MKLAAVACFQQDLESRTLFDLALDFDAAFVLVDDLFGNREAQADPAEQAAFMFFETREALIDAWQHFIRDTNTLIIDGEYNVRVFVRQ